MLVLPSSTPAGLAALAQVIFASLNAPMIRTGESSWPFAPDSLDFSAATKLSLAIDATGKVTFTFAGAGIPSIHGTVDATKLEAQLVSAPNYMDYDSPSSMGPAASVSLTSPRFTKQKSGVVFLTAEFNGTQSAQDIVSATLYRDFGAPGQVTLNSWAFPPGGLGSFNWSGHIHDTDVLPDNSPHTWTVVANASGGSQLSVAAGQMEIIAFEIGGPG